MKYMFIFLTEGLTLFVQTSLDNLHRCGLEDTYWDVLYAKENLTEGIEIERVKVLM